MSQDNVPHMPEVSSNDYLMKAQFFTREFSPEECNRIIATAPDLALTHHWENQLKAHMPFESTVAKFTRKLIPFSPQNQWIFNRLSQIIYTLNDTQYQFEINNLVGTQLIEMHPGDEHKWHVDVGDDIFSLRKLSFVLFLSPPDSYQGGYYHFGSGNNNKQDQDQGTFTVHPSFLMTRITPIESGCLRLLATWGHGQNPFS